MNSGSNREKKGVNSNEKYLAGRIEKTLLVTSVSGKREEEFRDN